MGAEKAKSLYAGSALTLTGHAVIVSDGSKKRTARQKMNSTEYLLGELRLRVHEKMQTLTT